MKIALFTNGLFPYVVGGMQKHSYYLAKYLAKNKIYVDIYHFVNDNENLIEELDIFEKDELEYINHFCFSFEKPKKFPGHYIYESYLSSKKIYEKFLLNNDVNFVYAQGFMGWHYVEQKNKGKKLPPISVNFHGLEMFQEAANLKVKIEQYLFKYPVKRINQLSDFTYSLGGKLTKILEALTNNKEKVLTMSIGIDDSWLLEDNLKENEVRKFIFLGRYERRKGVEELTEVINLIKEKANFEFHFIGPIPEDKKIISDKVKYHGLIKDVNIIKNILQGSDVLVTPSYSEGMPTVILEAMASGCAVIATDVGAVCEEVDSSNGWLIEPGNKIQLENTILEAISLNEEVLINKKNKSIEKIRRDFLWDSVIEKTISQIKSIL